MLPHADSGIGEAGGEIPPRTFTTKVIQIKSPTGRGRPAARLN